VGIVLAVVYPIALLLVVVGFRFVGEQWWPTTIGLYLPRIGFALPLPFLTIGLIVARAYRWLLTQLAALLVVVFPLMGLTLGGSPAPTAGAVRLRLLTMNIALGQDGIERVVKLLRGAQADVVILEGVASENVDPIKAGLADYSVSGIDQFLVASRLPIEPLEGPPPLLEEGFAHSAHSVQPTWATRAGPLRIYATHTTSPHTAFDDLRGDGLLYETASGRMLRAPSESRLGENTALRVAQVRKLAGDASAGAGLAIIAGDTNLPGLSWAFARWLGDFHDAFSEVGSGFGYTYPAHHRPWMRIDRVLGGPGVRFLDAMVLPEPASTHRALVVELELR
jgi:endonuclease/exonuclease/phosphatase (EEP) superfamily protein YafD